jgi:hypothetical protein
MKIAHTTNAASRFAVKLCKSVGLCVIQQVAVSTAMMLYVAQKLRTARTHVRQQAT